MQNSTTFTIPLIKPHSFKLPSKKLDPNRNCFVSHKATAIIQRYTPNPEEPQVTPRYPTHPCVDIRGQQIVKSSPTPQLPGLYQLISRFYTAKNFNIHFSGIKKQNCTARRLQGCIAPRTREAVSRRSSFVWLKVTHHDGSLSSCGENMSMSSYASRFSPSNRLGLAR